MNLSFQTNKIYYTKNLSLYFFYFLLTFLNIGLYYVVTNKYDEGDINTFILVKRYVSFGVVITFVGLGVLLPKKSAIVFNELKFGIQLNNRINLIANSSILINIVFFLILLLSSIPWNDYLSQFLFGSIYNYSYVILVLINILSQNHNAVTISILRGMDQITMSNYVMVFCVFLSVVPFTLNIELKTAFLFSAIIPIIFSTIVHYLVFKPKIMDFNFKESVNELKTLFSDGLWRVPGDLALEGMLLVPTLFLINIHQESFATSFGLALIIISITKIITAPVASYLLPEVSKLFVQNKYSEVKMVIAKTFVIIVSIYTIAFFVVYFNAGSIAKLYFHSDDNSLVYFIKAFLVIGYLIIGFYLLRNPIDAYYKSAKNSHNISISFAIQIILVIVYIFNEGIRLLIDVKLFAVVSLLFPYALLSMLSFRSYTRIFK